MKTLDIQILDDRIGRQFDAPNRGSDGSAGLDLRAMVDQPLTLEPGMTELVPSGIAVHIKDPSYAGMILPRSGLGHRAGLVLGNLVGLIDSDYTGALMISAWNRSAVALTINPGDRIAQLLIVPIATPALNIVETLGSTTRGAGGFGSTG